MKKQNTKHFKSVNVRVTLNSIVPNVLVQIYNPLFQEEPICTFHVPLMSLEDFGKYGKTIPSGILRARSKHDYNITFDHYSLIHS